MGKEGEVVGGSQWGDGDGRANEEGGRQRANGRVDRKERYSPAAYMSCMHNQCGFRISTRPNWRFPMMGYPKAGREGSV